MFWKNKNESDETQRLYERELAKKDKRIAYLESRIRGIQTQAINSTDGIEECCYNIKGPDGRFNVFYLPFIK